MLFGLGHGGDDARGLIGTIVGPLKGYNDGYRFKFRDAARWTADRA